MNLKDYITLVPDWPQKGIMFKDITPLMSHGPAYQYATVQIVKYAHERNVQIGRAHV
jgi:adenine phosphoribosyltransferase